MSVYYGINIKKIIRISSFVLLALFVFSSAYASPRVVAKKWDTVTVTVDTDWFSSDIEPLRSSNKRPIKHLFQFSCPTATVVNLQLKFNSITSVHNFNGGTAIGVDNGAQYAVILHRGMSYNIQHKTGTQACKVIITESSNVDL